MYRIDHIHARCIEIPLQEVFETSQRRATSSPIVVVELKAGEVTGYGEATPVRYVTGENVTTVVHDIATAADALEGAQLNEFRLSSKKLAEVLPYGKSARAGVEMAIFDAFCKSLGIPLYAFLGGAPLRIETDVTIPICPPDRARERAAEMAAKGFKLFKVKVGKDENDDIARVIAINDGAPGCSFIIDANQGFRPSQAVEFVKTLVDCGLKIRAFEQPVDAIDLEGMRYVTEHAGVPVFADESAQTPADVIELIRYRAASGVNVKIQKSGMVGALEIKSICSAAGMELMFGCMLESRIGQSAAVHIGCATSAFSVFDLDSDLLLDEQPVTGGAERRGPVLKVPDRPGLGCDIPEGALKDFGKSD
ncbi:MAG: dipeptide epimerase [Armatimonadota bacterium]|nr:dipeptide epimerase [bacterium]